MDRKSILITGCSSGIGKASALILQACGYRVFATARKMADVEKLQQLGLESLQLDVTDAISREHTCQEILKRTGGTLDALFNNAGFLQAGGIGDLTSDMLRAQFETNVFGPMELIRLLLPIMRKQGHGRIIQNSSILSIITIPYFGAYNASKFALDGFSNTLRQELFATNIHVSIFHPGPLVSELRQHAYEHYQHAIPKEQSAYKTIYQRLEAAYFKTNKLSSKLTQDPSIIKKYLLHALESQHPKAHYYVGKTAKIMHVLHTLLPDKIIDWIMSKNY